MPQPTYHRLKHLLHRLFYWDPRTEQALHLVFQLSILQEAQVALNDGNNAWCFNGSNPMSMEPLLPQQLNCCTIPLPFALRLCLGRGN
jgi:hypothetical protein